MLEQAICDIGEFPNYVGSFPLVEVKVKYDDLEEVRLLVVVEEIPIKGVQMNVGNKFLSGFQNQVPVVSNDPDKDILVVTRAKAQKKASSGDLI